MKILLDTCAIIWALSQPESLSISAKKELLKKENEVYFSPISCGEIACAQIREKVKLDRHWKLWIQHYFEINEWGELPINREVVSEAYSLPEPFHADPADRIIVATARIHKMPLITADRKILQYPHVNTIW